MPDQLTANSIETTSVANAPSKINTADVALIIFAKFFERASYFGFKVTLLFFLLDGVLKYDAGRVGALFGILSAGLIFSQLLGGILGDLVLGNKNAALIGSILQCAGMTLFCFPSDLSVEVGVGLIALGVGFYSPNLNACLTKIYLRANRTADSGFALLFSVTNLGAFLGAFLIAMLGLEKPIVAFVLCASLNLASAALFYFVKKQSAPFPLRVRPKAGISVAVLISVLLCSAIFSFFYEYVFVEMTFHAETIRSFLNPEIFGTSSDLIFTVNYFTIFMLGSVFAVIWFFVNRNQLTRLAAGYLVAAAGIAALVIFTPQASVEYLVLFIVMCMVIAFGELFIYTISYSIVGSYVSYKYLAIVFGAVALLNSIVPMGVKQLLPNKFYESEPLNMPLITSAIVTAAISLIIFSIYKISAKNSDLQKTDA